MKKYDKIILGLVIGGIFPVMIGMLFFVIWFYTDRLEAHALKYGLTGLSIGLLIDILFLKRWINKRYVLPVWFVAGIYIFYNIGVYGFFMGFPVFNLFLGLLAGYYFGHRICSNNIQPELRLRLINRVPLFTGLIMTLICISSGYLALMGDEAGHMIKEVLGLGFEVTKWMVWAIVLMGGPILIFTNMVLTRVTIIKTIKNNDSQ